MQLVARSEKEVKSNEKNCGLPTNIIVAIKIIDLVRPGNPI